MRYIEFLRRVLRPLEMLGKAVPDFTLASTDRGSSSGTFTLSALRGEKLVLYFYPKDNTPGCTIEGTQFRDLHPRFVKAGCSVYGVSRDGVKSHENFKAKMGFPFELLSDESEKVCKQFGVMKMKSMYGRKVRGIERSTFVIDRDRAILREWRGVRVPGHAQEVLDFVEAD